MALINVPCMIMNGIELIIIAKSVFVPDISNAAFTATNEVIKIHTLLHAPINGMA